MELKSNELRIGNYVNHKELGYVQVYGMNLEVIQFDYRKDPYYDEIPFEKLSYVPLTEEILLKCGFVQCENEYWYTNGFLYLSLPIGTFCINGSKNSEAVIRTNPIKHLHQLQNLYFALTNTELTVNL